MSSQSKLIKDILSTYDSILENKKISEATDVYDNVNFKSIGHGNPSSDNINTTLLQDVQTAAKNAGLNVDITTAISGHDKGTRHETGNAVDIAIINGIGSDGATNNTNGNAKFRELGNKLKDVLVSMGYVWNSESGNPKAILWQTNTGGNHFNHVHVSNTTNSSSNATSSGDTSLDTLDTLSSTSDSSLNNKEFAKMVGGSILSGLTSTVTEEKVYSSFGKNYDVRYGEVIIPKDNNEKIKSPVSGVITSYSYNSDCSNQLVIKFQIDDNDFYLEYCGLKSASVRVKNNVSKGDLIGLSDSDVRVSLYNSSGDRKHINTKLESQGKSKSEDEKTKSDDEKSKEDDYKLKSKEELKKLKDDAYIASKNEYSQLLIKGHRKLKNAFKRDEKPKKEEEPNKDEEPKNDEELRKIKKIQENINRIKSLL